MACPLTSAHPLNPALGRRQHRPLRRVHQGLGVLLTLTTLSLSGIGPARAIELQGRTYFATPPVEPRSTNYRSTSGEAMAEYMITITVPTAAGVGLGGLELTQTRGVDRNFPFNLEQCRAFLGEPRREQTPWPATVRFDQASRRFNIQFKEPVPPGQTVTMVLRPWTNPLQSDVYMFSVMAFPAGPEPVGAMAGFATFPIYPLERW